ncbi:MAG TPA: hypothetical protein VFN78_06210, partial [Ktedonobacterales bacterium]|nr:hypothetical protein [Ktedonobacterales bacterium]
GLAQRERQLRQVAAAPIGQFDTLEIVPDALVGVEFGGVAGQLLQVQALDCAPTQEVLDRLATMNRRAIPDDQQPGQRILRSRTPRKRTTSGEWKACSCICMNRRPSAVMPLTAAR